MPNTIRLHRVFATSPEKLYRAFTEGDAMAKWLPPDGFTCTIDSFDARVGGRYRMRFRNFTTGDSHAFGGEFVEIIPNEKLVYTDRFDDPNLTGEILATVTIRPVSVGAELRIVQENVPDPIPEEACYAGWQQSLVNLARLIEPDIQQ
ncbi:SRPBCC family protein [Sedimentitalea sp. JM2-8]|uniref:SRPBCC family protein n=1 Tax=Sedimentitalea xiamensis TaxID=3050037 RepID=A0ABT7FHT6_9RHOB|nr:SRPBCC family protein [Sedimentitalea xiamensis]MDK3074652.1 SRPBCC family protein [Sedimentitalea xiamensis]